MNTKGLLGYVSHSVLLLATTGPFCVEKQHVFTAISSRSNRLIHQPFAMLYHGYI
jgi:hypothetical protein